MQLNTKHFGVVEIDEKGIIDFTGGLPGFEDIKKFVLFGSGDESSPFRWLQSVDDPKLAFAVVDPFLIKNDYNVTLNGDVIDALAIEKEEDALIYSIVVVPDDISEMSMNLKAPVVINTKNNRGMQIVLDTDMYSVRHYILEELQRREGAVNARIDKEKGPVDCNK